MSRLPATLVLVPLALAAGAADAQSRGGDRGGEKRAATYVSPYIEATQIVSADLTNDDTVTYTSLAAGVDAGIATARTEGQVSYRYERRFGWGKNDGDESLHSGLLRGSHQLTRNLSIEAGAIATRSRYDSRGADSPLYGVDTNNVTQVYSAYAGPTFSAMSGPIQLNALYRLGYTKVETPDTLLVAPGQPRGDYYDDSTSHLATASAGFAAGTLLPVGVTVSGAYEREDAGQLGGRYEGYYGRADATAPLSRTLAVRAGVGYEKIETSERDPLLDAAGVPVLDRNGRYRTDPNSPRRIAYNTDGLIYDAGVVWRPSTRLELQANAGWRYGSEYYTGSLSYRMRRDMGLQVVVYDGIQTFGRQLRDGLAGLPTSFQTTRDPFGQQFGGCVFGSQPGAANGNAGGCLDRVFQSISGASYRARGIDAILSVSRGPEEYGIGVGYANRRFFAPRRTFGLIYYGTEDESLYGQAFWSRQLDSSSSFDFNAYAGWSTSGVRGFDGDKDVFGTGMTGTYFRSFGRVGALASLGVYAYDQDNFDSNVSAQALLGARYQF